MGCFCIAGHVCGPVRMSPGGRVEQIVVAGGYANLDTVEVYDIALDTWTTGMSNGKMEVLLT